MRLLNNYAVLSRSGSRREAWEEKPGLKTNESHASSQKMEIEATLAWVLLGVGRTRPGRLNQRVTDAGTRN